MPPVFISWKSPAEERAVGDGAFFFASSLERGAEIIPIWSRMAAFSIDEKKRRFSEKEPAQPPQESFAW
jgi:hypothetical protein